MPRIKKPLPVPCHCKDCIFLQAIAKLEDGQQIFAENCKDVDCWCHREEMAKLRKQRKVKMIPNDYLREAMLERWEWPLLPTDTAPRPSFFRSPQPTADAAAILFARTMIPELDLPPIQSNVVESERDRGTDYTAINEW